MQGKLCHPESECEPPPEFVFLAFDGNILQEHGKKKVSGNYITDIFYGYLTQQFFFMFAALANLHTYPES